jgi:hypothetical protein
MLYAVITTINGPTRSVTKLSDLLKANGCGQLIVVADEKGPYSYDLEQCQLLSMRDQSVLFPELAQKTPKNHYARKNLGYLYAISHNASCIYETDDDNRPNGFWKPRQMEVGSLKRMKDASKWVNVYSVYSEEKIWPRGLPLEELSGVSPILIDMCGVVSSPIQQGLADHSPDVDAVWRLVLGRPFYFDPKVLHSVYVPPSVWSPFNSQSTWWWPDAYPLMYIPSYCSFRMCDIWRSFIAQRCLWEIGYGVIYHPPEVIQDRNHHDLSRDFKEEVPGYLRNQEIVGILERIELMPGKGSLVQNLNVCYRVLVESGIFPTEELDLLAAWCDYL